MNIEFREEMKKKREDIGLTQTGLATAIKMSPQMICDIEAGRKNPSLKTLVLIANRLGLSLDDIFLNKNYARGVKGGLE